MDEQATRVFVVDMQPLVRDGLKARLGLRSGLIVAGEANDLDHAVRQGPGDADIFLVDIDCARGLAGELEAFVERVAPAVVLMLGWEAPAIDIQRSMSAGARGYLLKDTAADELLIAASTVRGGGTYFGQGVVFRRPNADEGLESELSPREREVLLLVGQGLPSKLIASRLNLSVRTVESHRMNAKRKLQLRSNGELIKFAVECVQTEGRSRQARG